MEIEFKLPYPPSVNRIWRATKKGAIYLSDEARAYRRLARDLVATMKFRPFSKASLSVSAIFFPPDKRKRDIDGPIKTLLDALQDSRLFDDDEQIKKLFLEMREPNPPGEVHVKISELEEK